MLTCAIESLTWLRECQKTYSVPNRTVVPMDVEFATIRVTRLGTAYSDTSSVGPADLIEAVHKFGIGVSGLAIFVERQKVEASLLSIRNKVLDAELNELPGATKCLHQI